MLVQAQVVPWWGTGRPAEFHPVTGIAYRQEDRRVRLQNRVVSTTARRPHARFREIQNSKFFSIRRIWFFVLPGTAVVAAPRGCETGDDPEGDQAEDEHSTFRQHDDHGPRPDHEHQEPYEK